MIQQHYKKVFVFWSGGLDSTYLVQWLLEQNYHVITGYIEICNNDIKTKMELAAINKMYDIFNDKYPNKLKNLGVLQKIDLRSFSDFYALPQAMIWMSEASRPGWEDVPIIATCTAATPPSPSAS